MHLPPGMFDTMSEIKAMNNNLRNLYGEQDDLNFGKKRRSEIPFETKIETNFCQTSMFTVCYVDFHWIAVLVGPVCCEKVRRCVMSQTS
jgi:hypothetical protein